MNKTFIFLFIIFISLSIFFVFEQKARWKSRCIESSCQISGEQGDEGNAPITSDSEEYQNTAFSISPDSGQSADSEEIAKASEKFLDCNQAMSDMTDGCMPYFSEEIRQELDISCTNFPSSCTYHPQVINFQKMREVCYLLSHPGIRAFCLKKAYPHDCQDFAESDRYLTAICNFKPGDSIPFEPRKISDFS